MEDIIGISNVTDWEDLLIRTSMLYPDCGFESHYKQFDENISSSFSSEEKEAWLHSAKSDNAIVCIQKFSKIEGNFITDSKKGLGRVSEIGFPRLGGVLYKHLRKKDIAPSIIISSIERNLYASYLACLLVVKKLREKIYVQNADELWEKWIPRSYNNDSELSCLIDNIVAYGAYWGKLFSLLGLDILVKLLHDSDSDLNRSIAGMSMVGVNLVIAERDNIK